MTDPRLDRRCGRPGCACPHTDPCYRGFDEFYDDDRGWVTVFCTVCHPQQRRIIDEAPTPQERDKRLRARSGTEQSYPAAFTPTPPVYDAQAAYRLRAESNRVDHTAHLARIREQLTLEGDDE